MLIKVFFVVLVVCIAAIITVALATHYQVKRHLRQEERDAQVRPMTEAAEDASEKEETP